MEDEQKALLSFVQLHGSRLKNVKTSERVAYLVRFSKAGIPLDIPLEPRTVQQLATELDVQTVPVRWLLQQVQTYDQDTSNVLGLIFDNQTVLAHVIQCGSMRSAIDEQD